MRNDMKFFIVGFMFNNINCVFYFTCSSIGALKAKYGISDSKYDDFYEKCVRRSLIDFLQSCRRKKKKNQITTTTNNGLPIDEYRFSPLPPDLFSPRINSVD